MRGVTKNIGSESVLTGVSSVTTKSLAALVVCTSTRMTSTLAQKTWR